MMARYRSALVLVIIGISLSWSLPVLSAAPAKQQLEIIMLHYEEQEAGTDIYPVRVLVNDEYVRIDDGNDQGDFVLLDRLNRQLYSINHDEQNILVVEEYPVADVKLPAGLELSVTESIDPQAPRIQGRQPVNRQLLANGRVCLQVVVVPGLLEAAAKGLAEYARVLGARQLHSMETVPEDLQTPCFQSRYAYAPARHLEQGLPVQEWDGFGYSRSLVDYSETMEVSPALFRLPTDYAEFRLD